MKVTVDSKKGLKTNLKVFVDKKTIDEKIGVRLTELSKTVNIKGFRPGKVPIDVLKKQFGKGVLQFQERSFNAILTGDNTVISAPTGSGKTEAFAVPIIQKICENNYPKKVFALLIYPLRALARDQVKKINEFLWFIMG